MAIETAALGASAARRAIGAPRLARAAVTPRRRVAPAPAKLVPPENLADRWAVQRGEESNHVVNAQRWPRPHVSAGHEVGSPQRLEPALSTVAADGFHGDGGLAAHTALLKPELWQWLVIRGALPTFLTKSHGYRHFLTARALCRRLNAATTPYLSQRHGPESRSWAGMSFSPEGVSHLVSR
jgi:hypothetical protein